MNARRIVLVDDNPDDVALTIRALRKNGFPDEVTVARDGAEALDLFSAADSASEAPPALILLDLKLPKIDGLEVLRRIRASPRTRFTPVIVLTSSQLDDDIMAAYRNGANAFVRKPVSFPEFADAARTLGVFWLTINETTAT